MRLGIIARSDNTGLGNQTMELVKMLNPDKILLINSIFFNNNKQHPEWYKDYDASQTVHGMPTVREIRSFLQNLDVVISCETFYHSEFVNIAKTRGVKTILQYNYELFGNLAHPEWPLPDILLAPSIWNLDIVMGKFGRKSKVMHLPPPTDSTLFNNARKINLEKDHKRILHIAGKKAAKDRNGTDTIIEMMKYSNADFELVIKTQTPLDISYNDPRITIDTGNPDNRESMYEGFDAMVLPRRYAGLCLPMNEALMSALPVFMTDISPNNALLPEGWLVRSDKIDEFKTKSMVNVYNADPQSLAKTIDDYVNNNEKIKFKNLALEIGLTNFSVDQLKEKYLKVISND
jgi:glycosyltransferase involved in cell wall biosynthesis